MPRRIAIVMFEGCQPLDAVGPFEVFAAANQTVEARGKARAYEPLLVAPTRALVKGHSGLAIAPHQTLGHIASPRSPALHTLMVAGGSGARSAGP